MYIQQIEIDNFKSFHGKTVIPFKTGFTTVSGPNGSGKSNIIDSILFCLGLSTSRTMRAEKLTDLINNLSSRREAQVTILFGTNESDDDLNKIVVSRKIKDSGKAGYASTYYLNGRVVTLSEIHDTLSQHNISPGSFNVLMQGDVTGIINMSATERRKIIDEIAGVAEFDRKIDQAQKELASVSASIERFSILMEELANRLAQLGEERNQALQYQALKDEKQRYEGQVLGAKLADLQKALKATDDNIVQARKNKQQAQENLKTLEATVQKTRQELTHIANEVKRKGEDQQIALKKQIEGLKGAIATKRNVIEFGVNKKKENHQSVENLNGEIINIENKIDDLRTAIEGVEQQSKEIQVLLDQEKAAYTQLEAKLMELTDSTGEMAAQRQQKREQLEGARDRFGALNRDKQDMEAELMRGQKELAFIQNQLSVHSSRFEELSIKKTDLEKKVADFQLEDQAFQSQINQLTLSVAKIRVDLKEKTAKYNGLQVDYNRLDAQKRAYEDLNFGRSVDTILNSGISGVHGTLAQLGRAVEPYGLALEIAIGGRIKNIVVDDDRVAMSSTITVSPRA